MNLVDFRPKSRSKWRIALGKIYFTSKRRVKWYTDGKRYARTKQNEALPFKAFTHETPLLRKLKDVDMWYQYNKITNLKIAIQQIDGVLVRPGETFSYWRCIGKPTRQKGYVDGMVLHYGKFMPGVGGGLCQLSNLIYWMTIHTPLTVTERYRHSFDVFPDSNRTQPFGSGATCFYNYLDLQIENTTENTYQLCLRMNDTHLIGEWRCVTPQVQSYEIYESEHRMEMAYWGDYIRHNKIRRRVLNGQNIQIDDEFVAENYAIMMYQPFLESTTEEKTRKK